MISRIIFPNQLTKCTWGHFGLVGVSSLDHKAYLWKNCYNSGEGQVPTGSKVHFWRVNPVVPSSWEEVSFEIEFKKFVKIHAAEFSFCCTKIMFRYSVYNAQQSPIGTELLFFDPLDQETFILPASTDFQTTEIMFKNKNVIDWFPQLQHPKFLDFDERYKTSITFTRNEVFYYAADKRSTGRNLVGFDLLHENLVEVPLCMLSAAHLDSYMPISLIGSPEGAYFTLYINHPITDCTEIYRMGILNNRLVLNRIADIGQVCVGTDLTSGADPTVCGDSKMAVLHGRRDGDGDSKYLTVLCLDVPSLKYLTTWTVQKLYGNMGAKGELLDGIKEDELKKLIGCQKGLF